MAVRDPKITSGRTVRSQVIGHQLVWNKANFLAQFPHQFHCGSLVSLLAQQHDKAFADANTIDMAVTEQRIRLLTGQ
jgi:hypothetical protein